MADIDPGYMWPQAYQAISEAAIARAFWLSEAVHAVRYEAIHGAPKNLTDEQKAQRTAILNIAAGILENARDREMDEACKDWATFRRMTK